MTMEFPHPHQAHHGVDERDEDSAALAFAQGPVLGRRFALLNPSAAPGPGAPAAAASPQLPGLGLGEEGEEAEALGNISADGGQAAGARAFSGRPSPLAPSLASSQLPAAPSHPAPGVALSDRRRAAPPLPAERIAPAAAVVRSRLSPLLGAWAHASVERGGRETGAPRGTKPLTAAAVGWRMINRHPLSASAATKGSVGAWGAEKARKVGDRGGLSPLRPIFPV